MEKNWTLPVVEYPRWRTRQLIEGYFKRAVRAPRHCVIKPIVAKPYWMVYFCYLPTGSLTPAHRFTLERLRDCSSNLLIIYASSDINSGRDELNKYANSLIWKDLSGFDFSAYSIALWLVALRSPLADVFVFNDSTFGPFNDVGYPHWKMLWDLTSFTGSYEQIPHVQSYAFIFKRLCLRKMISMASVFQPIFAFNSIDDVVNFQELRLGMVASKKMSVGALWSGGNKGENLTLVKPFDLLDDGFPFLKKSLLGKHQQFQSRDKIIDRLNAYDHPLNFL